MGGGGEVFWLFLVVQTSQVLLRVTTDLSQTFKVKFTHQKHRIFNLEIISVIFLARTPPLFSGVAKQGGALLLEIRNQNLSQNLHFWTFQEKIQFWFSFLSSDFFRFQIFSTTKKFTVVNDLCRHPYLSRQVGRFQMSKRAELSRHPSPPQADFWMCHKWSQKQMGFEKKD